MFISLSLFTDGEEFVDIPNTGMRTTIAKRLTLSKVKLRAKNNVSLLSRPA